MKKIIITIGIIFIIYVLDSSYYFYDNYLSCKGLSNYECVEKSYKQHGIEFEIVENIDSKTGKKYNMICYWDSCITMKPVVEGIRKHTIEERGIKNLFIESFF